MDWQAYGPTSLSDTINRFRAPYYVPSLGFVAACTMGPPEHSAFGVEISGQLPSPLHQDTLPELWWCLAVLRMQPLFHPTDWQLCRHVARGSRH